MYTAPIWTWPEFNQKEWPYNVSVTLFPSLYRHSHILSICQLTTEQQLHNAENYAFSLISGENLEIHHQHQSLSQHKAMGRTSESTSRASGREKHTKSPPESQLFR